MLTLALSGCRPEASPSPTLTPTLLSPSIGASIAPTPSPAPSPTGSIASNCGEVIDTTEPSAQAAGPMAVFSSPAGLSFYNIATDKVVTPYEGASQSGLLPRFRTSNQVSFVRQREPSDEAFVEGQNSVYEFDLGTGEATEILRLPNRLMGQDWSPDGNLLLYQLRAQSETELFPVQLCEFDARSGTTSLVTQLQPPIGTGTGQREETMVTWSPQGTRLLVADTAQEPSIVILAANGYAQVEARSGTFGRWLSDHEIFYQERPHTDLVSDWTWLSLETGRTKTFGLPARSYRPALSPDGRWIAFDDGDSERPSVFLLDMRDGTVRRLIRGYLAPVWLDSETLAASGAGRCHQAICPIPWSTSGTTVAIDLSTGDETALRLPTTLQERPRNGLIDVWLGAAGT
jgi:hypothetical protein